MVASKDFAKKFSIDIVVVSASFNTRHGNQPTEISNIKSKIFGASAHEHTCNYTDDVAQNVCVVLSRKPLEKMKCVEITNNTISLSLIKLANSDSWALLAIGCTNFSITSIPPQIDQYIRDECAGMTINAIITFGPSVTYPEPRFVNVFPLENQPSFIDEFIFYDRNVLSEKNENALVPFQSFVHLNQYNEQSFSSQIITDFAFEKHKSRLCKDSKADGVNKSDAFSYYYKGRLLPPSASLSQSSSLSSSPVSKRVKTWITTRTRKGRRRAKPVKNFLEKMTLNQRIKTNLNKLRAALIFG